MCAHYCYYLIFEDKQYLQLSYEYLIKVSEKLVTKDKKKFLNCPWPKLIIEEWGK